MPLLCLGELPIQQVAFQNDVLLVSVSAQVIPQLEYVALNDFGFADANLQK